MFSHDLEDMLLVIDGRPELGEELRQAPRDLRAFVQQEFDELFADSDFEDAVLSTVGDGRHTMVPDRIQLMPAS